MNKEAREILEKAGWYEGREIDISEWERISEEEGFLLFDEAKKFLREFGGLCIHKYDEYSKEFHPYHEFESDSFSSSLIIAETINEKAICVGIIYGNNSSLYISESGKIYDDYGFVGNTIYEAWDCILETISRSERKNYEKSWLKLGLDKAHREAIYMRWYSKEIKDRILEEQNVGLTLDEISEKHDISLPCIIKILNKK